MDQLPLAHPKPGTWPATQAGALTWKGTGDFWVCRPDAQPTEPCRPGLNSRNLLTSHLGSHFAVSSNTLFPWTQESLSSHFGPSSIPYLLFLPPPLPPFFLPLKHQVLKDMGEAFLKCLLCVSCFLKNVTLSHVFLTITLRRLSIFPIYRWINGGSRWTHLPEIVCHCN